MSTTPFIDQLSAEPEQICAAHRLSPADRQELAIQVLGRAQPVTRLSREHKVSRKFLYEQAQKAQQALEGAFEPSADEPEVLFYLPVTKAWLRQVVLALVLICHASYRGVIEWLQDVLDTSISYGSEIGRAHV